MISNNTGQGTERSYYVPPVPGHGAPEHGEEEEADGGEEQVNDSNASNPVTITVGISIPLVDENVMEASDDNRGDSSGSDSDSGNNSSSGKSSGDGSAGD